MSNGSTKTKIFFHIGYPKTATIFLQKNLFSKHREVNFFCRRYSKNDDQIFSIIDEIILLDDDKFLSRKMILQNLFKNINFDKSKINLISDQNILCHKFRENNDMYRTLDRINQIFKKDDIELKLFFSVRAQEEAILSIYRQFYFSYFSKELPSLNGIFNPNTKKEINEILESLKYFNTYNFLKKKFGENNIKIFSYELLKLNRNKFFLEICNYLNINPSIISVIQNSSYENKFSYKKVSLINSIIYNIKNYKNLIRYLPTKIVSFFNFLLFDYIQGKIRLIKLARTKFNSQNKKKILEFYKEDNLKLQSEIKINLL